MFKFIKESMKEFDHVVWPTTSETKKYFNIVTSFLVAFTLFIFVVWTVFSAVLFTSKDYINPAKLVAPTSNGPKSPANTKAWTWAKTPDFNLNLDKVSTNSWSASVSWTTVTVEPTASTWAKK